MTSKNLTLEAWVAEYGPINASELLRASLPLMHELQKVHDSGELLMIKPDMVSFSPGRELRLAGSRAEKHAQGKQVTEFAALSTPFTAPEELMAHGQILPRTDVYRLCATLYYAMTGTVPAEAPERLRRSSPMSWRRRFTLRSPS